jgi:predicted DNA-binding transcriptional regulator AlpA
MKTNKNLITLNEVTGLTKLNADEIRDLQSKDLFPYPFGVVENKIYWSSDAIRIWIKKNGTQRS